MEQLAHWISALSGHDPDQRAEAAEFLCHAGGEAADATLDLVRACADSPEVSQWAVAALEELGKPPRSAVAELSRLVAHPEPLVAYWSATLLGRLGRAAAEAEAALATALESCEDLAVRQRAVWALGRIGVNREATRSALHAATGSEDPRLARLAVSALAQHQK